MGGRAMAYQHARLANVHKAGRSVQSRVSAHGAGTGLSRRAVAIRRSGVIPHAIGEVTTSGQEAVGLRLQLARPPRSCVIDIATVPPMGGIKLRQQFMGMPTCGCRAVGTVGHHQWVASGVICEVVGEACAACLAWLRKRGDKAQIHIHSSSISTKCNRGVRVKWIHFAFPRLIKLVESIER